jgi:hypothetical protein
MDNIRAREVYHSGAFSQAVGILTLFQELSSLIPEGTLIRGNNSAGHEVQGKLYDDRPRGSRRLYIQYNVSAEQGFYVRCRVGANPYPVFDDCKSKKWYIMFNRTIVLVGELPFVHSLLGQSVGRSYCTSHSKTVTIDSL